jgi:O-antigen/teichoic acid export membrane protein
MFYAANIVVAFIMSPIYIHALGNRDYGLWELLMSVVGYMGLLDLGIGPALVRFVSVAEGKNDKDDLQKTISTSFMLFLILGFIAVLFFIILTNYPGMIAGKESKSIMSISTVFILFAINASMLFPLQVFIATLMGMQRHYYLNNVRFVLLIAMASLNYYFLVICPGNGLIVLSAINVAFTFIQVIIFAGAVHLDKNIPKISLAAVCLKKAKEMALFGVKSVVMMAASRLQNQSVPIIIGKVIGLSHIVFFVMPNRLIDYAKGFSQAIGFPLAPYFGSTIGRGDEKGLARSWITTTLAVQIISLPMVVVLFFCGSIFLELWLGREYAVAGQMVLYIMLAGLAADSLAANAFRILTAKGRHGRCAFMWLILSALSIPVGIGCAKLWGIEGVAAAVTGVTVAGSMITIYYACVLMDMSVWKYFINTAFKVVLPLLIFSGSLGFLKYFLPIMNYPGLILHILVAGMVYVLAVWHLTIEAEIRKKIKNKLVAIFSA